MGTQHERGRAGEDYATEYLRSRGYTIVGRNWRCSLGEIDIIASYDRWIIFVEVKTRSTTHYGHPFDAVVGAKIRRLRKLATAWRSENEVRGKRSRIDVVAVHMPSSGDAHCEHLRGVSA